MVTSIRTKVCFTHKELKKITKGLNAYVYMFYNDITLLCRLVYTHLLQVVLYVKPTKYYSECLLRLGVCVLLCCSVGLFW